MGDSWLRYFHVFVADAEGILVRDHRHGGPQKTTAQTQSQTLSANLNAVEAMTGMALDEAFVDKGYRGHSCRSKVAIHIAGVGSKRVTRALKKLQQRRSAIEPKIGHLKSDHRMARCWLWNEEGDKINALLADVGSNMRKLQKLFYFAL